MQIDKKAIQDRLRKADFTGVFTQELGWDFPPGNLTLEVGGRQVQLQAVAEKKGLVAYVCPAQTGKKLPDYATRRKIDREVTKHNRQHLIVFTDASKTTQIWQWVKRELGKPAACREHTYHVGQPGDGLIQKLTALAVSLQEEESLTHVALTGKVRKAFDVEKVTKRFYDRFKNERDVFASFLKGIPDKEMLAWYVSVMLNRLMFIYFIQSKGFLGDGDGDYLRTKLAESKLRGRDRYYREFLCPLFFEGFAKRQHERSAEMNELLGTVPHLNGGLFLRHQIEELHGRQIRIPDAAFEKIFEFFAAWDWTLEPRHPSYYQKHPDAKLEINPDVLGYIFEKYINQKQMGAYYTKEDITEYIAKNTIVPFLFDAAAKKCQDDFAADAPVWGLLREDPDRYIYPAVRRGVVDDEGNILTESALPDFVLKGMHDPKARMFERRYNLGEADLRDGAGERLTLPTETWREYVCRRQRCLELREKLGKGEVQSINDLITLNLDIRQFAQDAIANCQSTELLAAFFESICTVTVLDPTCGSGAFLFAALNILEPLYEACLDRMEAFMAAEDAKAAAKGNGNGAKRPTGKAKCLADFRQTLKAVNDDHPNAKYFIFKSIIIRNLFGVDIMEEAVEICKLRLFLKLVAQVDPDPSKPNLGVEPLPDIDFNIRAGNTLVGYTTIDEIRRSHQARYPGFPLTEVTKLEVQAQSVAKLYSLFCRLQTNGAKGESTPEELANAKNSLRREQQRLADELDRYLAGDYGIDADNAKKANDFEKWRQSHRPFHWFVEFYHIMTHGGFDVVIGNPPYVVYSPATFTYTISSAACRTVDTKNLYAMVCDRSLSIARSDARVGLIVQLTVLSSERVRSLQDILLARGVLCTVSFPRRPESIFDGVEMPVAIILSAHGTLHRVFSSRVSRFYTQERENATSALVLTTHDFRRNGHRIAKIGTTLECAIYTKISRHTKCLDDLARSDSKYILYYQEACRYWAKGMVGLPFFKRNGKRIDPPHGRTVCFDSEEAVCYAACLVNSSLFYWFYSAFADCEHINDTLLRSFPIPNDWDRVNWNTLYRKLAEHLVRTATRKVIQTKHGHRIEYDEMKALLSKSVIDSIDDQLGGVYGLTLDETDFIINYDVKYRMGTTDEKE